MSSSSRVLAALQRRERRRGECVIQSSGVLQSVELFDACIHAGCRVSAHRCLRDRCACTPPMWLPHRRRAWTRQPVCMHTGPCACTPVAVCTRMATEVHARFSAGGCACTCRTGASGSARSPHTGDRRLAPYVLTASGCLHVGRCACMWADEHVRSNRVHGTFS